MILVSKHRNVHKRTLVEAYSPGDGDHLPHCVSVEGDGRPQFLYDKEPNKNTISSRVMGVASALLTFMLSLLQFDCPDRGSHFIGVADEAGLFLWGLSFTHPGHWPGLPWALTCPLSRRTLPGCSKQTCVLTSRNVVGGNNIKVAFNMTLERLNPAELLAGPSLQSYVVQKRIVQSHRALF